MVIDLSHTWQLTDALSKISSLLGSYTPEHYYQDELTNSAIKSEDSKTLFVTLTESWLKVHPEGSVSELISENIASLTPEKKQIGLWIDNNGQILIVRSIELDQRVVLQDTTGQHTTLSAIEALDNGRIFLLFNHVTLTAADADTAAEKIPVTATDWFIYSIKKKRNVIQDIILATVITNLLAVGVSLYTMQVYDRVVPSQSNSTLIVLTIGVLIAIGFDLLLKLIRVKISEQAFKDIDLELSSIFFKKAMSIRLDARPKNVGTFISELRQYEFVRNFMTSATLFTLADAPFAIFFCWFIYLIGGPLAIYPILFFIVLGLLGHILANRIKESNQELVTETHKKSGFMIEAIDGIESIKATSGENQLLKKWQHINKTLSTKELFVKNTSLSSTTFSTSLQQLSYILMVATGAVMIHNNSITQGALIACTILSGRILAPMLQLPQLLVQWTQVKASLQGLDSIMLLPSDANESCIIPDSIENTLSLENVQFQYEKDRALINITKLTIQPGNILVIMGRVGSGKSTLLKLLSGLYKPSQGRVLFGNLDMAHLAYGFVREQVGYLPQDVRLIQGTLKENLMLGNPYATDNQVLECAEKVGLDRLIKSHPAGLELNISEGGLGLSGGQKQMVALARILLRNPKVILLDEPTASLDNELENQVMKSLFSNLSKEHLVIVVSHKPAFIKFATHLLLMDTGKVAHFGTKNEVIEKLKSTQNLQVGAA